VKKRQRENTSNLLYRIIEITFGGVIISTFLPGKFSFFALIGGSLVCIIAYEIAYHLDGKEDV
jgi:uncharacterized membrane protein HdeD (DUF308 family)